jgi:predicted transcriptional regulator
LELPDDIAGQLAQGQDLSRAALEALIAESCREHRLSDHQAAQILGLSRHQLDGFLKARGVFYDYTIEDLKRENETAKKSWHKRQAESVPGPEPSNK